MYMEGGNDRASFYSFYVNLENDEDIIMGQHVIIEPDFGQGAAKQGLWIPAGFVVDPEGEAFVWAANSRMKLEKRPVVLGEYDPDLDMFQIAEGLDNDSLIAWPDENCVPGAKATTELVWDEEEFDEESFGSMDEEFYGSREEEFIGEEPMEGEFSEEMPMEGDFSEEPTEDAVVDAEADDETAAEPAG